MFGKKIALVGLTLAALALLPGSSALAADTDAHVDASGANMQPAYPETALLNKESGAVVVSAKVMADGRVKAIKLRRSSGYDDLDTAAANAVNGWKFVPATQDGRPIDGWADVQIVFAPPS